MELLVEATELSQAKIDQTVLTESRFRTHSPSKCSNLSFQNAQNVQETAFVLLPRHAEAYLLKGYWNIFLILCAIRESNDPIWTIRTECLTKHRWTHWVAQLGPDSEPSSLLIWVPFCVSSNLSLFLESLFRSSSDRPTATVSQCGWFHKHANPPD